MHHQLQRLLDPIALARRCGDRALLASSYDRRGGNHDWSNYIRIEGSEAVMMDADGPGCITRIWTADPQHGMVRIYLDERTEPAIRMPFRELFGRLPLSFGIGGESPENHARSRAERLPMGHTSYCPIPFARRCKVTIEPEDDYLYYQINWRRAPEGAIPAGFDLASADPSVAAAEALLRRWEHGEPTPAPGAPPVTLQPGEGAEVFRAEWPGAVRELAVRLPQFADEATRSHVIDNLWLTAHFDDDEPRDPSVRAPIGPMFLDLGQEHKPRTLLIGTTGDGVLFCRFAMPHAERAVLRLTNRGIVPVGPVVVSVAHEPLNAPDHDLFRFRATWHTETPFGPDHRD
ncbi:MAG: DUF2961 domain-containing protein, partial [Armatimonadetes bacterium]|nr:DUF2961 domain-containing protein [Armatimonadota bacterium]